MSKKSKVSLIIGLGLIVIASPAILTKFHSFIYFDSESADISTTIGGIISPIINLIGAILIYISFEAQVKFNDLQIENQTVQSFLNSYQEIKDEFYKIKFNTDELSKELKSKKFESALDQYYQDFEIRKEGNISFEYQFKYVLYLIKYFIEDMDRSGMKEKNKEVVFKKLFQFYCSRIDYFLKEIIDLSTDFGYDESMIRLIKKNSVIIETKRKKYNINHPET